MAVYAAAALPLLIWLYLLLARGGFWRLAPCSATVARSRAHRSVAVIVPARNEAAVIGEALHSLLQQRFEGTLDVFVVDDASSDDTAALARRAASSLDDSVVRSLTVIRAEGLPAGWSGKLWALSQGLKAAASVGADYWLLTDADIAHEPESLQRLVDRAESQRLDLVSHMVLLSTEYRCERWLIPAFVFFFFMIYPPAWVAAPQRRTAAAAGGCMLVRPQTLERAGGLLAIRAALIDDCALARIIKRSGGRIWLGLARDTRSLRPYGSLAEIGGMVSRTAFSQLQHSYGLLAATLLGLLLTYVLPVALLVTHQRALIVCGASAWALMSLAYWPMVRFYRLSPLWAVSLPSIALFYAAATLHSALQYALGRGGKWKDRVQDSCA
jgi:hopene-associated glycosyltransferase HpnB